jgi:16S rRNA (cytosine1407-C5)-methyltransferase
MLIKNNLLPGELGKAEEHLLGLYYIQELSSMLSVLALEPKQGDLVLDLCASPGSKTTQIVAKMENSGGIIANDKDIARISILASNLERIGASNVIMTRMLG